MGRHSLESGKREWRRSREEKEIEEVTMDRRGKKTGKPERSLAKKMGQGRKKMGKPEEKGKSGKGSKEETGIPGKRELRKGRKPPGSKNYGR